MARIVAIAVLLILTTAQPVWPQAAGSGADQTDAAAAAADQGAPSQVAVPGALPPNANIDTIPAKRLFGSFKRPTTGAARAIGFYSKGCMSGAAQLPLTDPSPDPAWQVMRPSRNRNWANPAMVSLVERLARDAKKYDSWNGLLVGDMSQPRGGPMASGHASHQVGLDADVWLTPMPTRILTTAERENMSAKLVVKDRKTIDNAVWDDAHARLIKRAASYPEVERIFVHPPIKAALCQWATGDRSWLAKVRPYFGHNYHFHIRIACPKDSPTCKPQPVARPQDGTGCGKELAWWMGDIPWTKPKRNPNAPPVKPPPPLTLSGLPAECRAVVLGH